MRPSQAPQQLSKLLRDLGLMRVHLHADDGRLRCAAPPGVLTPDLLRRIRQRRDDLLRYLTDAADDQAPAPLTYAQQRIWLHQHYDPQDTAYNLPLDVQLDGPTSVTAARVALSKMVSRQEALRTIFPAPNGEPHQVVLPAARVTPLLVDLSALPPQDRELAAQHVSAVVSRRPFAVAEEPGVRWVLARLAPDTHRLLLTRHHLVSDGWSFAVMAAEFADAYRCAWSGRPHSPPPLATRYTDFARWQTKTAAGGGFAAGCSRWQERLAGARFDLGQEHWSLSRVDSPSVTTRTFIDAELFEKVRRVARETGGTAFTVLCATIGLVLGSAFHRRDVVIGAAVSGRTRPQTESLAGCFASVLPMRLEPGRAATFRDAMAQAHQAMTQMIEDQEVPLEQILEVLGLRGRGSGWAAPFTVVLAYQNTPSAAVDLPGLTVWLRETVAMPPKFPLTITATETAGGLELELEHDPKVWTDSQITELHRRLRSTLDEGCAETGMPTSRLTREPAAIPTQRLAESAVALDETLGRRFEAVARRTPDAVAVGDEQGQITFRVLRDRARRVAAALYAVGVRPGERVAVCAPHGIDLVAALIGVSLCGAAYVPLDPEDPPARHEFLIDDARVAAVITLQRWCDRFAWAQRPVLGIDRLSPAPVPKAGNADHLAYLIYTSGSTGAPKGVMVTHRNVLSLLNVCMDLFGFTAADTWTMTHSAAFDFSVWEMWGPLLTGGRLVAVPRERVRDAAHLRQLLVREQVSVYSSTPSAYEALVDAAENPSAWPKTVVLGGERCDPAKVRRWLPRTGRIVNMFGITETTVHVTHHPLTDADAALATSPIGRPLPGVRVGLVDGQGRPTFAGGPGEIEVAGWGVAVGYLHQPGVTAGRFRPAAIGPDGSRAYRSGDLGAVTSDGGLTYLGRMDHQVKIRGHRIEPQEVTTVLCGHGQVGAAAVVPVGTASRKELVAYVAGRSDRPTPSPQELRRYLSERLPGYMVPARFIEVASLPLTRNGKLDTAALSRLPRPASGDEQPASTTEKRLAELWCELLELTAVGRHDDFLRIGGDSLLMTMMHARLRAMFGVELALREVYEAADLAGVAALIDAAGVS